MFGRTRSAVETHANGRVFTSLFLSSPKLQKPVDMPERKFTWFRNKKKMALKRTDQDRVSLKACIIHANECDYICFTEIKLQLLLNQWMAISTITI